MPVYTYQAAGEEHCVYCVEPFDRRQKVDAPRLQACPECGSPLRRVMTPPNIAQSGPSLNEDNIAKHGFTRYRKAGKGVYEKTSGRGPDVISDED